MARDRIVQANPEDLILIERTSSHPHSLTHLPFFSQLWSLRPSLSRLRPFNQALAETTNDFGVLAKIEPPTPSARTHVVESMSSALSSTSSTLASRIGLALAVLLRRCRCRTQSARFDADRQMWTERGARTSRADRFMEIDVSPLFPLSFTPNNQWDAYYDRYR